MSRRGGRRVWLTRLERKTRRRIIRKLADQTPMCVLNALAEIERSLGAEAFRVVFKSIPADPSSELLDGLALEASLLGTQNRTRGDDAHPVACWERGSNENGHRMLGRFLPKGSDLSRIDEATIQPIVGS